MGRRARLTLERLAKLPTIELRAEWARIYAAPAPALSPELLRLGIGYRLQEQKLGRLGRSTRTLIRRMAAHNDDASRGPLPRKLTPGTRLVRDWHGVGHNVTVLDNGFEYDGRQWKSLSAIAKAITGTHWNGPRFFGFTEPKK